MASHALQYIVVIPVAWLIFRRLHAVWLRQAFLLVVSYLLYAGWGLGFLALLIGSSVTNYFFGRWLRARGTARILWLATLANLLLLAAFKYLPALLPQLGSARFPLAHVVQPIGISFWTFQALSYLFDTYRDDMPQPSFREFLLYMAFWPTVLSGPICRLSNLLPQFRGTENATVEEAASGMDRIGLGLFMIGLAAILEAGIRQQQGLDSAFRAPVERLGGSDVWCMAFGYGLQLFFNFAGYSHIVIGAGRLFGFQLAENFDRPYLSRTPSEFWTRWHMSLSSWIRDYLFLPLAMLNSSKLWRNAALVISMVLFGLWHRGTALLALWGLYQGAILVMHRQWQEATRRLKWNWSGPIPGLLSWLSTITLICVGWIFFRSDSLAQAMAMFHALAAPSSYANPILPRSLYFLVLLFFTGYLALQKMAIAIRGKPRAFMISPEARLALYSIAIYFGILHTAQTQAFIYFRF